MWILSILACGPVAETGPETPLPELTPGRELVDFGAVLANTTATEWLKLENTGGAPLTLGPATFLGGAGFFRAGDTAGVVVQPGESHGLALAFDAPDDDQALHTVVTIPSDDPAGELWVDVVATPVPNAIRVDPALLDFGSNAVACALTRSGTVTNTGATAVVIEALGSDGNFTVDPDEATNGPLPWTVLPQQSYTFDVGFSAPSLGQFEGSVLVVGEADAVLVQQYLVGEGTDHAHQTETFVVDGGMVDVMLPVQMPDFTPPYSTDTEPLIDAFPAFLARLDALGVEYQIAVMVPDDGCPAGAVPMITPELTKDERVDTLNSMLFDGTGIQHGLIVTAHAVSSANRGRDGCNERLFRDEARLAVIGYTYVGENHPDTGWILPVNNVMAVKDDPEDVTYYGIIEDLAGLRGDVCGYGTHSFWSDATDYTGGEWYSICDDVEGALLDIADLLADPQTVFPLAQVPDTSTLLVTVGGAKSTDWTYRASDNSVVLGGASLGREVVVDYDAVAVCP